jgi:hypothetical protein
MFAHVTTELRLIQAGGAGGAVSFHPGQQQEALQISGAIFTGNTAETDGLGQAVYVGISLTGASTAANGK